MGCKISKIFPGIAFLFFYKPGGCTGVNKLPAFITCFGPQVNHPVGTAYHFHVMFYHDDGMSLLDEGIFLPESLNYDL